MAGLGLQHLTNRWCEQQRQQQNATYQDYQVPPEALLGRLASAEDIQSFNAWVHSWSPPPLDEWRKQHYDGPRDGLSGTVHMPRHSSSTSNSGENRWVQLKTNINIQLLDGKLSILAALGSRMNLIRCNTENACLARAELRGRDVTCKRRNNRLNVSGVSDGSTPCSEEATYPSQCNLKMSQRHWRCLLPVLLPARKPTSQLILGSASMQDKDAVILLRKGKEMLLFPGPGGYKIEWPQEQNGCR